MTIKYRLKRTITADQLLVLIGLFAFFRPTIFEKYETTNAFFNALLIMDFVVVGTLYFFRRNTFKNLFFIISLVFYFCMIYSTLANKGSTGRMLQIVLVGVATVVFVLFLIKYAFFYATQVMRSMAWIYIVINILSQILMPNGITTTGNSAAAVFFLGQPTRFAYFYVPALLFCYLGDEYEFGYIRKNTIFLYIICLSTLILAWTVGSSLALLLLIPFFAIGNKKIFNAFLYFGIQLSAFAGLTFYSIQNRYSDFITTVLHKDVTLSSRTNIWDYALLRIASNPQWGTGIQSNEYMRNYFGFVHVHNHLLQVLFQCGYVGLVLFLAMLFVSYYQLNKYRSFFPSKVIAFFLFMVGIQLLVDTVDGVRNHYLFMMAMGAFISPIKDLMENNLRKEGVL